MYRYQTVVSRESYSLLVSDPKKGRSNNINNITIQEDGERSGLSFYDIGLIIIII